MREQTTVNGSPLEDDYGRTVTGLRISLTDRCNLDCFYCHNEGLGDTRGPRDPQEHEMSAKEVVSIAKVAHEFEVYEFKLTGGEPMLRKDLEGIVDGIATLPEAEVSMTTNGIFLSGRAKELAEKGLERVNVSMDTPDPEAFQEVVRGTVNKVYEGVNAAVEAGLTPVKLNMVMAEPTRRYLDDMLDYVCSREGVSLQIIEYMPELVGNQELAVDIDKVKNYLGERSNEVVTRDMHHRQRYIIDESTVEVVDPVGNPEFCANCHRLRVTHRGELKSCLNRDDLRKVAGLPQEAKAEIFRETVKSRIPYYGEYMIKTKSGSWSKNPRYEDDEKN